MLSSRPKEPLFSGFFRGGWKLTPRYTYMNKGDIYKKHGKKDGDELIRACLATGKWRCHEATAKLELPRPCTVHLHQSFASAV
jgi:hypothetical protein